jgi:hypothetical protein
MNQYSAEINARRPAPGADRWQQRPDDLPFLIGQIHWVAAAIKRGLRCTMFPGPHPAHLGK